MATGPSVSVSVNAELSAFTVNIFDAATSTPAALVGPSVSLGPSAEAASVTFWASAGSGATLLVDAELAAVTFAATDGAVNQPNPITYAPAEAASIIVSAFDAGPTNAGSTGTGATTFGALQPGISVFVNAELAAISFAASGNTANAVTRPAEGGVHRGGRIRVSITNTRARASVQVPGRKTSGVTEG